MGETLNTAEWANRTRLSIVRQELLAPVGAIIGYATMLFEEVECRDLVYFRGDAHRLKLAAESLYELVDQLIEGPFARQALVDGELDTVQAMLRHDLRNPLSAIKGYGEFLLEDCANDGGEYLRPELESLLSETARLLASIDRIVDFADADSAAHRRIAQSGTLAAVVSDLARTVRPLDRSRRIFTEPGRILVVDDNESSRSLAVRWLIRERHEVSTATDGAGALDRLAEGDFDLVLLDLVMPGMNGYEVLTRMKADERLRGIPVVMISGLQEADSAIRCIEAGAEDYLTKPFNLTLLRARIDACLERKRWRDRERHYLERLEVETERVKATQHKLVQTEKMASLGQLVAGIAHEINTPVGVSLTAASKIVDDLRDLQIRVDTGSLRKVELNRFLIDATELAELVVVNNRRAADLVQTFKAVAADRYGDSRRSFCLREYLEELVAGMGDGWQPPGIAIAVTGPAGVTMDSYPGALFQALSHLVANAQQHAFDPDTGGTIRLEVEQPGGEQPGGAAANDQVLLTVEDDGKGIAPEHLGRIFDPFFTTRRNERSIGLGLHIVHNLVTNRLGGSIACESRPGQGTRFTLRLPLCPLLPEPAPELVSEPVSEPGRG